MIKNYFQMHTKKFIVLSFFAFSQLFSQEICFENHPTAPYFREVSLDENGHALDYSIWEPLEIEPLAVSTASKPQRIDQKDWDRALPYLLPSNHPLKPILDKLFAETVPLSSPAALKKAGFKSVKPNEKELIVASHPKLKGYLVKAYLDGKFLNDLGMWRQRAKGAEIIRQSIEDFGYQSYMKAPKKWIYTFQARENTLDPSLRLSILIVEDMKLANIEANIYAYKHAFHKNNITALFNIITKNLLVDTVYIDNAPFSYDYKIAFVDTEHVNVKTYPLKLDKLSPYFSEEMRVFWRAMIKEYENAKKK